MELDFCCRSWLLQLAEASGLLGMTEMLAHPQALGYLSHCPKSDTAALETVTLGAVLGCLIC